MVEVFDTLLETKVLTASWRREYNEVRPQSFLGWRPPAPEPIVSEGLVPPLVLRLTQHALHRMGAGLILCEST